MAVVTYRFVSASQTLNILQPKPKPIAEFFSKKGIALVMGLTIPAIACFLILDRNRYALLHHLGLTEYLFTVIENGSQRVSNSNIKNLSLFTTTNSTHYSSRY